MPNAAARPTVAITVRSMWRIRFARELSRYLVRALVLAGVLASMRFAIDPPRPVIARSSTPGSSAIDRAAEGFASLFARRYLTWDSHEPQAHRLALAPFVGSSMEDEAGLQPPERGEQQVQWTQIVQSREPAPADHVYTVAAQTDTAGLLYLTVSVVRETDGRLALAGYPAFVGAPASNPAALPGHSPEVQDTALKTMVTRALRNYLAGSESELAADLTAGARVALPGLTFELEALNSLDWSIPGRSVLAQVRVHEQRGARYTLGYELEVVLDAGRWEVSQIQTNPDS